MDRMTRGLYSFSDDEDMEEQLERQLDAAIMNVMRAREASRTLQRSAITLGRQIDRHQPPPGYDDGRYLSNPTPQDEKPQNSATGTNSLAPRPDQTCGTDAPGSSSLLLPPAPRYTRSPSPSAGLSKSRWPRGSFPDGPSIVLSLDCAGGDRTMKQLDVLESLMCTISRNMGYICPWDKGPNVLKPCQVFHLIVGSGTGGLIAILLGRLEMSVQAVKDFYNDNEEYIFGPLRKVQDVKAGLEPGLAGKAWGMGEWLGVLPKSARTLATERLEEKIAWIVKIRNKGTELVHPDDPQLGKVLVTAVHQTSGGSKTTTLRSYPCSSDEGLRPSIVEAARATMAHETFFKPARISGTPGEWIGSPSKYCNPAGLVLEEYPGFCSENVLVSVGVDLPNELDLSAVNEISFLDDQPARMSFEEVMDWNARVCARIERKLRAVVARRQWCLLSETTRGGHQHFRLGRKDVLVAQEVGRAIKGIRKVCVRREKERLRAEEVGQQSPIGDTLAGDP